MKITNRVLTNVDGSPVRQPGPPTPPNVVPIEGKPVLVSDILGQCALAAAEPGHIYTGPQAAERYTLAVELHKTMEGQSIEISVDMVTALKKDMLRLYAPVVSGQMISILEGN